MRLTTQPLHPTQHELLQRDCMHQLSPANLPTTRTHATVMDHPIHPESVARHPEHPCSHNVLPGQHSLSCCSTCTTNNRALEPNSNRSPSKNQQPHTMHAINAVLHRQSAALIINTHRNVRADICKGMLSPRSKEIPKFDLQKKGQCWAQGCPAQPQQLPPDSQYTVCLLHQAWLWRRPSAVALPQELDSTPYSSSCQPNTQSGFIRAQAAHSGSPCRTGSNQQKAGVLLPTTPFPDLVCCGPSYK
jgi:hypothetical protein